ncbi:MAG: aldo/keto reductase [Phycisphaerales bacterium]
MQYRTMPRNGDELSILGFGCMRLPMKDGKIDEERAIRQIRHAIDRGVNYVDSAWPYHAGQSEIVLGKALKNGYRDKVKLATKLPSWMIKTRADMDRYLAAQLEKLGTDRIDYYLLHSLNGGSWDILHGLGVEGFLDQAKADGRIVNAGFSFHGLKPDFMRIVDAYPWVFAQIQFNYLDEQYQAGVEGLRYAASKGLGMIVMEPLRGGNLGVAAPPAVEAIWNESPTRRTPAEWALRWIWNQPEPTVVLSGMNDEAQIDENLATANAARPGSLTDAELALVERAGRKYRELMKVGCTGCGYCMPCPAGVTIPICFEEYNRYHMFGRSEDVKYRYALRMSGELVDGKPGYASQCVRCGKCLEKCPQQIRIPDRLAEVAADMDGPQLAARLAAVRTVFKIEAK